LLKVCNMQKDVW